MLKSKKVKFTKSFKKRDERIFPILHNVFFYFPIKVRINIIISFVLFDVSHSIKISAKPDFALGHFFLLIGITP